MSTKEGSLLGFMQKLGKAILIHAILKSPALPDAHTRKVDSSESAFHSLK
jgi:hypothetical protein